MPQRLFHDSKTPAERRADATQNRYDNLRSIVAVCGALVIVGFLFLGVALSGSYYKLALQHDRQIAGEYTDEAFNHQAIDTINSVRKEKKLDSVRLVEDNGDEPLIAAWEGCAQRLYTSKAWEAKDCTYDALAGGFKGKVKVDAYQINTDTGAGTPEENAPSQEQLRDVIQKASRSTEKRERNGDEAPYTGKGKPWMLEQKASHVYVHLVGDGKGDWVVYTYSIVK